MWASVWLFALLQILALVRGIKPRAKPPRPLRPAAVGPRVRLEFGAFLEKQNCSVGIEVGVQNCNFARWLLQRWPACRQYVVVDLWAQQSNYLDRANVDNRIQEERYLPFTWESRVFACGGGGRVDRAPLNWGSGVREKGSIDRTINQLF